MFHAAAAIMRHTSISLMAEVATLLMRHTPPWLLRYAMMLSPMFSITLILRFDMAIMIRRYAYVQSFNNAAAFSPLRHAAFHFRFSV